MSIQLMIAIAALAGFVGAGFIWFAWSAAENLLAMRAQKTEQDPNTDSAET